MTVRSEAIPQPSMIYQTEFFVGEDRATTRKYAKNNMEPADRTVLNVFSELTSRSKGVADTFALMGRSAKFVTPYMPEGVADWTSHVANFTLKARSVMSVPFLWTAIKRFNEKITFRSICELAATLLHASALFVMSVAAKTISSIGSMFKALVDSNDFVDNCGKFFKTRELCSVAAGNGQVSDEVKSGLDSQWHEYLYKIVRFSLAAISGLVTGFVFCAGMTLPVAVAAALLAGTVVSAFFSVAAEWVRETADFVEIKV